MKKLFNILVWWLMSISAVTGQNSLTIPYFLDEPSIDGLPLELKHIPWKDFTIAKKTSDSNEDVNVRYKIAYCLKYLYVIVEASSNVIIHRDRAYQNGDGLHMVIAKPDSNNKANEFYVLRFSPADSSKDQPARNGVWYYNIDLSGKSFGPSTVFACKSTIDKSYFELLLPWNDVHPYHPLFSTNIGLNICFVKAIGDTEKNYYFIKDDRFMQSELQEREYEVADFEPVGTSTSFTLVKLVSDNIKEGDSLKIKAVSLNATSNAVQLIMKVLPANNYRYKGSGMTIPSSKEITIHNLAMSTSDLSAGAYKLSWRSPLGFESEIPFTILPLIDYSLEEQRLAALQEFISQGDYNSLLFMLKNIELDHGKLKPYETAGAIRERIQKYKESLSLSISGAKYAAQTGIYRRAFRSNIDGTLQPYSIKLPANYNPEQNYPLLVMLHGSGSDDQGMLVNQITENNFIEIAPYGRGTSNCFTSDNSEVDVKEAIDDAIANYRVDTSNIIITGFSMGGYGAYRLFYEYPNLFKAVSVFAGHPSLASKWLGEGYPDFLDEKYLIPFKGIPVFIYHSKNDLNCPYELTRQLIDKLERAGADLDVVISDYSGHGMIESSKITSYFEWLKKTISKH